MSSPCLPFESLTETEAVSPPRQSAGQPLNLPVVLPGQPECQLCALARACVWPRREAVESVCAFVDDGLCGGVRAEVLSSDGPPSRAAPPCGWYPSVMWVAVLLRGCIVSFTVW